MNELFLGPEEKKVVVIGASGFLGAHVVQRLLGKSYFVKACVHQAQEGTGASEYLLGLDAFGDREGLLEIYECDLLRAETFDQVCTKDVVAVIHCGSLPFQSRRDANEAENTVNMHIKAMTTVLNMCQNQESIKKLILCSCALTITDEYAPGKTYSELDWNETSSLTRRPHAFAKTQTERLATEFAARTDCSFKLATILPATLMGPHLRPGGMNQAYDLLLSFLEMRVQGIPNVEVYISDVRDVANALVLAAERSDVAGRYIACCDKPVRLAPLLATIVEHFSDCVVPQRRLPDFVVRAALRSPKTEQQEWLLHNVGRSISLNTSKALDLGLTFRDPNYSAVDTVSYLRSIDAIKPGKPSSCVLL
jgi:nucleoside-diphosphate-sugar epimerase